MTDTPENILRRVRALLDRAEHASTPEPERELAMVRATQLMADYGIQRTMLAANRLGSDPIDQTTIKITDPYSFEKASLLRAVAKPLGCETVRWRDGRRTRSMTIVGAESDRERVNMLYTSLLLQAERGMLAEVSGGYYAADTRAMRAGYLAGFAERIRERLKEAERRAARDYDVAHAGSGEPGTAIVLADRAALVDRRFAELFPKTEQVRMRSYDEAAWDCGDTAGRRADIGTTRVNGAGTRQLKGSA
jgi:hypothetical protein